MLTKRVIKPSGQSVSALGGKATVSLSANIVYFGINQAAVAENHRYVREMGPSQTSGLGRKPVILEHTYGSDGVG